MANYCNNNIVFFSENLSQIYSLFHQVKVVLSDYDDTPTLTDLLEACNITITSEDLRHFINDYDGIHQQDTVFYFHLHTESAWSPLMDNIDILIKDKRFQDISYVYLSEEPGCDVFINTDIDRRFLVDSYRFYYEVNGISYEEYFPDISALYEYISSHFTNVEINQDESISELMALLEEHYEDDDSAIFTINEFEAI